MKPDEIELVERGRTEQADREREQAQDAERRRAEADAWNYRRTVISQVHGFLPQFYEDRWIQNPAWTRPYCGVDRVIENPEKPLPVVEWRTLEPGAFHGTSEFTCEGLTFRCYWKNESRGSMWEDRADWDDGWWPTFVLVRGRWPFRKEIKVYRPADVAEALGR